jgi:hypothetical protein
MAPNMHVPSGPWIYIFSKGLTSKVTYIVLFHSCYYMSANRGARSSVVWLRHYAASRKVAGSIPDEEIGFHNWPNPQLLTEMSTRNLPGGKGRPARTSFCEPIV